MLWSVVAGWQAGHFAHLVVLGAQDGQKGLFVENGIVVCLFIGRKGLILLVLGVDIDDHPLFVRVLPFQLFKALLTAIVFRDVGALGMARRLL